MASETPDWLPPLRRAGHTAFRNGLHGDGWLEKGEVMRDPVRLDRLASRQAAQLAAAFPGATLLAGASQCGAVLATFVARHLALPVAFLNVEGEGAAFHRMHLPAPGERAVLIDDLVCTGNDARRLVRGLREHGLEVLGLSAWLIRPEATLPDVAAVALAPHPFRTFAPEGCPLCAAGEPLDWTGVRE
ncbi:orotate phosphoribosyltransferase [Deinococcus carri]|uniref:Orotate phosphoribosyltransferase n=1 Tax=Deinococcus carri TaxID=1211323 RepID=A0ABP9W3I0_9DEIO